MMKKLFTLLLSLLMLIPAMPEASAATVGQCQQAVVRAIYVVAQGQAGNPIKGYLQQLSDLSSTNLPTFLVIEIVQELMRDAEVELKGICTEASRFSEMNEFFKEAYGLQSCQALTSDRIGDSLQITSKCFEEVDRQLDELLGILRQYLTKQAVRTSIEPVIQKLRGLNARLLVLSNEYTRLVKNFFTFSFRLGETIIGEHD